MPPRQRNASSNISNDDPNNAPIPEPDEGPMPRRQPSMDERGFDLDYGDGNYYAGYGHGHRRESDNRAAVEFFSQMQPTPPEAQEPWMRAYWRPAMAFLYMFICLMDFVVFPGLMMVLPAFLKGFNIILEYTAWQSLTMQSGGLFHVAMGAILGAAAWTRGKEKEIRRQMGR